ncbi:prenyltransferase/squalene oxidase repeat-containing protein [Reyranella sp.]|uniref:prenyltransferase/squalene oxidase repeat-containing protein n=1 Tax=Reyranella sp. TaxID=1929291 RepID=UPI003784DB33
MSSAPATTDRNDLDQIEGDISRAVQALIRRQRHDGHWVFELEADATIPSEYVLLRQYLGEPDAPELERKIGVYLRRIQGEHGGWPLFHGGAFDISASVKAYFCLKMIGDSPGAPHMARARSAILAHGGAERANVFTRILLAQFGQLSWAHVPTMPVEIILLPRWFPIHLSRMSYWARTVIVPLLVLAALRKHARNPRGVDIQELFATTGRSEPRLAAHVHRGWALFFNGLDCVLKAVEPLWPKKMRQRAVERCVRFVTERLNGEDGLGAIYPAMANSVMMFDALGYASDHPSYATARRSIEKLLVVHDGEAYCQPCVSPVWDTALAAQAMLEVQQDEAEAAALRGLDWLRPLQELEARGDWSERRPQVRPGGWAFQYRNAHYPDLDDTAVVVMAMDRARRQLGDMGAGETGAGALGVRITKQPHPEERPGGLHLEGSATEQGLRQRFSNDVVCSPSVETAAARPPQDEDFLGLRPSTPMAAGPGPGYDQAIARGVEWIAGLQSGNGGWAAFDADNVDHYLNNIPFADHGALLDPPTADVSARCISMLAQLGETTENPVVRAGLDYLEREQMPDGSWFGRWGVNYIYGTWSALCALGAIGLDGTTPSVRKAADWLIAIQNGDGGWGEDCTSYKLDYRGYEPAPSTASQTAWALLGLMAAGEVDHPAVARGITWLRQHQDTAGLWRQDAYTGGGFPRVFYLRYHGYPAYFPLWALARYRNLRRANSRRVAYGM